MTYYKYKDELTKGLAALIASIILAGTLAPISFAAGVEETATIEETQETEGTEETEDSTVDTVDVISIYPESSYDNEWFDEQRLDHDIWDSNTKNRLFLKVAFDDTDNKLSFDSLNGLTKLRDFTAIYSDSSNVSMVDIEFLNDIAAMDTVEKKEFIDKYIFRKNSDNKRAYLYIPVKPLMSHMSYSVTLGQGIVFNNSGTGNDSLTWTFNTMAIPSVVERDVLIQSVVEDYNIHEPIIIKGKFLYSPTVDVYFNNERAYRVLVEEDNEGNEYLEVYLPRGRNKLEPGLYDITVENSYNHSKWIYGALSVVPESDNRVPSEKNIYSTNTSYGDVSGSRRADLIRLDHAEPIKYQILKSQLKQYSLKSPLLEVEAEGYSIYGFALEIPIENGIYENYKVLRYNELSRVWVEENDYIIHHVDQRVNLVAFNPGIFVVVESKY